MDVKIKQIVSCYFDINGVSYKYYRDNIDKFEVLYKGKYYDIIPAPTSQSAIDLIYAVDPDDCSILIYDELVKIIHNFFNKTKYEVKEEELW